MVSMTLEQYAKLYYDLGLSIIPEAQKVPLVSWSQYTKQRASWEQVQEWLSKADYKNGIAVICGKVSGNLSGIDFEHEPNYLEFFTPEGAKKLEQQTIVVDTGHGGIHVWLRELGEMPRSNVRIVSSPEVDLLGEGSKMTAAPSMTNHLLCDTKTKTCPKSGMTNYKVRGSSFAIKGVTGIQNTIMKRAAELGWTVKELRQPALIAATSKIGQGSRNDSMFKYARYLLFTVELPDEIVLSEW